MPPKQQINSTISKLGTILLNNNDTGATNPFQRPIFLIVLMVISLSFIVYAIYYYMKKDSTLNIGYSFYGKDMSNYIPLFNIKTEKIDDCIKRCSKDPVCKGMTYQTDTQKCLGSTEGRLRKEEENYTAWVKPTDTRKIVLKDKIILGYASQQTYVKASDIEPPLNPHHFCFGMTLTINDFYENYGKWRHILHKGTRLFNPDTVGLKINYQNWENIATNYPDQCIGIWLSPFTNNLRIAITTISIEGQPIKDDVHAYIQQCNDLTNECYNTGNRNQNINNHLTDGSVPRTQRTKNVEYVESDIKNIPINKPTNIIVNVKGKIVEIYINYKLSKIYQLSGYPDFNNEDLYVMNPLTFKGEIRNMVYLPMSADQKQINDLEKVK
jgi:hypothetical protein